MQGIDNVKKDLV